MKRRGEDVLLDSSEGWKKFAEGLTNLDVSSYTDSQLMSFE